MAIWKSIPALVAGNSFVFKPSPLTPLTALRLKQHFVNSGFEKGLFSCVFGDIETGQNLINNSLISKISFTGSINGGGAILNACSKHIKPSTLELGGKSPLIIMKDSNIEDAVNGTLMANYFTQGQVCSNAARVFVHEDVYDAFKDKLVARVKKLTIGDPFSPDSDMGALICQRQTKIVLNYIEGAISEGARVLCGGKQPESLSNGLSTKNYILPCVLDNCNDNMTAVKEEIFGPVVTLLKFKDEDEVINRANNTETGLAGGVFSRDIDTAHRIAAKLKCGAVYINCYNVYPPGVPFGGFKKSGIGRENCLESVYAYTQVKSVYVEAKRLPDPFPSGAN